MLQIASQSRRKAQRSKAQGVRASATMKQRSAVRVTYRSPKSAGHWYAHGSYMERETATGKNGGFTADRDAVPVADTLKSWQDAGDQRIFKIIISPENGAHLDMELYTRDIMRAVQKDKASGLEWVAAVHTNTDHPHIHVAIRGVHKNGTEVRFPAEYIKDGFRFHAENVATMRLGYRTERDVQNDLIKQVHQDRVTSLDRQFQKVAPEAAKQKQSFVVSVSDPALGKLGKNSVRTFALERRLEHLVKMGLAIKLTVGQWRLRGDYMETLKTVQAAGDKQKMLARHMTAASSTNLRVVSAQWKDIHTLQGRVLGHGEMEGSEKRYMLFEGIDGTLYHLPHRKDTEELRAQRHLRKNEFVTLKRERGKVAFIEMGHADNILRDRELLSHLPYHPVPGVNRPGWLGRFDTAVKDAKATPKQADAGMDRSQFVAVALTDDQVQLLLRGQFPNDRNEQQEAYRRLTQTAEPVTVLGGKIHLDYSAASRLHFAELRPEDKGLLDQQLETLSAETRRRQQLYRESTRPKTTTAIRENRRGHSEQPSFAIPYPRSPEGLRQLSLAHLDPRPRHAGPGECGRHPVHCLPFPVRGCAGQPGTTRLRSTFRRPRSSPRLVS